MDTYRRVLSGDFCEYYDMLVGPDGFECLLTEPEDRNWYRDGRVVVDRLNDQHAELTALRAEVERLREERRWRDADKEWPAGTEWCLCRWREPTELMCLWFDGHGDWKDFGGEVQYPMYWQPLPAPPAKEE